MTDKVERMSRALCNSHNRLPDGCAAICMDRLGGIPKEGCRHAGKVHGERAQAIIEAMEPVDMLDTANARITELERLGFTTLSYLLTYMEICPENTIRDFVRSHSESIAEHQDALSDYAARTIEAMPDD